MSMGGHLCDAIDTRAPERPFLASDHPDPNPSISRTQVNDPVMMCRTITLVSRDAQAASDWVSAGVAGLFLNRYRLRSLPGHNALYACREKILL